MRQDDARSKSRDLGWLFLIAIVLHILQMLAFNLLEQKGINPPEEIILIFSEMSILIPTLIYILIKRLGFRQDLGFRRIKTGTFFMCILLTFLVMPVGAFLNVLSQLFVSNTMVQMSDQLLGGSNTAILLIGAVYGPFCEELLFRAVFTRQYETITGPLRAGLISAALFGITHMNINQAVYAFALGFIFSVINKAAGSVYASLIIHVVTNAVNIFTMIATDALNKAIGNDVDLAASAEAVRKGGMLYVIIGVTLVFAIVCTAIAIPCVVFVAKHEDNLDEFVGMFTKKHATERWISVPLVIGICIVLFVMFGLGPVLKLFA